MNTTPIGSGRIILHLEDDDDDAFLFERALTTLHFTGQYRRVSNFEAAKEYLTQSLSAVDPILFPVPDILVTDGMATVPCLLAWLSQRPELHRIVRVILTGGMSEAGRQNWIARGFKSVLPKGSSLEEMARSVETILHT